MQWLPVGNLHKGNFLMEWQIAKSTGSLADITWKVSAPFSLGSVYLKQNKQTINKYKLYKVSIGGHSLF